MCVYAQPFLTLCHPKDCSLPLSMELFRHEYWRGLPCPPPGGLPDPGIEPTSAALPGGGFATEPPAAAVVQPFGCVQLLVTPGTAVHQASLKSP